jgi:hypothetical protein
VNVTSGKKHRVPRIVRKHSDELEDVAVGTVGFAEHLLSILIC